LSEYDPNNVFAKILRGEIPSYKLHEDSETLAFMDVMPQAPGHVLIVPKKPSRNLLDADPAVLGPLMAVTQKMALAVRKAFDADGVTVMQFNEAPAGQSVFHLHFHVIPRHAGVALRGHTGEMEKPEVLAENAQKIRSALSSL
jgi:histidine triad (HIT) family protein